MTQPVQRPTITANSHRFIDALVFAITKESIFSKTLPLSCNFASIPLIFYLIYYFFCLLFCFAFNWIKSLFPFHGIIWDLIQWRKKKIRGKKQKKNFTIPDSSFKKRIGTLGRAALLIERIQRIANEWNKSSKEIGGESNRWWHFAKVKKTLTVDESLE